MNCWIRFDILDKPMPVSIYSSKRSVHTAITNLGGKVIRDDNNIIVAKVVRKLLIVFIEKDVGLSHNHIKMITEAMEDR